MNKPTLSGLYAITDPYLIPSGQHVQQVEMAIKGGATAIQYRNKDSDTSQQEREALPLLVELCHRYHVPLIINDNIALARNVKADGVHLGQSDADPGEARSILGKDSIIGITCHDSIDSAIRAQQQGADYVAFGRFFGSKTKPEAPEADIDILRQAKTLLQIPVVAIGGITPDNAQQLIDAGADALAVIHGIFGQQDIEQAARRYADLFFNNHGEHRGHGD